MKYTKDDIFNAKKFKDFSLIISKHYNHTLVSSHSMRYQGRFYRDNLSDLFLLNYRTNNNSPEFANSIANYSSPSARSSMRTTILEDRTEGVIKLPTPKKIHGSLLTALESRRSVREFENMDLNIQTLSTLLFTALAVKGEGVDTRIYPRSYASGGGLYPVYLYFYANRVRGLKNGFYKYQPFSNTLDPVNAPEKTDFSVLSDVSGIDTGNCSMMGFWVYERRKNGLKYGDLGSVMAIHEAGAAMSTLALVGTLLGIGFCELGGYHKIIAERKLHIDGIDTQVIGCFVAGNQ